MTAPNTEESSMEVEELLARAWKAVKDANIPAELQEYAFKEALSILRSASPVVSKLKDQQQQGKVETDLPEKPAGTVAERLAKFEHESGVPASELERVFYFSDDGLPHLNGPRAKLGHNVADQAKAVAVAITAAYDYVRDETPISDDVVKAETTRLKIDLGGNWARTMGDAPGVSWIGAARQKQFKTSSATTPDALRKVVTTALGTATAE